MTHGTPPPSEELRPPGETSRAAQAPSDLREPAPRGRPHPPSFREALRFWLRLGLVSFGGPAGQIAIMHGELVERRRWIGEGAFLRGLNFCTLLPGPEAQQLATYVGWRLHGTAGGVAAGALFVLPGALVLLALSWIAAAGRDVSAVAAVFEGLRPVVVAIVLHAVWRIGKRALRGAPAVALAAAAFVAIRVLGIGFPWIVAGAALAGFLAARAGSDAFALPAHADAAEDAPARGSHRDVGFAARALRLVPIAAALWALPVAGVLALFGSEPFLAIATLFTKAAFVTFGGAYAVLPYVAEAAVRQYAWLSPGEMLNGLALAETTPGPLILVLQYVGFFAAWNASGGAPGLALVGAALTSWVTFLPSFLFVLLGGPSIERLHDDARIGAALGAVTAAVVGVVLNLAVFLGEHVFFPAAAGTDGVAILAAALALAALLRWSPATHWMVAAGAAFGVARAALG